MGIDYDLGLGILAKYEFAYVDEATTYHQVWDRQMSRNYCGGYESGIRIMEKFLAMQPKSLDEDTVRNGWVRTFVGRRGWAVLYDKDIWKGEKEYNVVLEYKPNYLLIWKTVMKVFLG